MKSRKSKRRHRKRDVVKKTTSTVKILRSRLVDEQILTGDGNEDVLAMFTKQEIIICEPNLYRGALAGDEN